MLQFHYRTPEQSKKKNTNEQKIIFCNDGIDILLEIFDYCFMP